MASINFYLDKSDKKGFAPIHLRINCNGHQIKVSTGQKIKPSEFNNTLQRSKKDDSEINHYLEFLKERTDELLHHSTKKSFSFNEVKQKLNQYIDNYKTNKNVNLVKEQVSLYGKSFTFIDLFAGAGGFSEGFLQAEVNNKHFDFIVANDINENCELTHLVRYNYQLGLDAEFLTQDITEPDFLDNLLEKIDGKAIDVVCGGPPCQSFSLAGKRKKFDRKDDLFSHYLEVIKVLKPKYFVMENVKGILTKDKGKIKELIIKEINSIVDTNEIPKLITFIKQLKTPPNFFLIESIIKRVEIESLVKIERDVKREEFIRFIEARFRKITPKIADYKKSKTDIRINTIRHGFNMLARIKEWDKLKRDVVKERDFCNVDNDHFVGSFTKFIEEINPESIINRIQDAFISLNVPTRYKADCNDILTALKIYANPFDESIEAILELCNKAQVTQFNSILESIRLYKIERPFVANASNYGVPQNRERVLFIGCRKDQRFISDIPATIKEEDKVTVFEALYDLDFIGNNEELHHYEEVDIEAQFNGTAKKMSKLLKKRSLTELLLPEVNHFHGPKEGRLIKDIVRFLNHFTLRVKKH